MTISAQILFFDETLIRGAGIFAELPEVAAFADLPMVGDLVHFPDLIYQTGESAYFRVEQRAFLAAGTGRFPIAQLSISHLATNAPDRDLIPIRRQ